MPLFVNKNFRIHDARFLVNEVVIRVVRQFQRSALCWSHFELFYFAYFAAHRWKSTLPLFKGVNWVLLLWLVHDKPLSRHQFLVVISKTIQDSKLFLCSSHVLILLPHLLHFHRLKFILINLLSHFSFLKLSLQVVSFLIQIL